MRYVYQLHYVPVKSYSDYIFQDFDFDTYSRRLHEFCFYHPEEAVKQHFDIAELVFVGTYDEGTGSLTVSDEPKIFDIRADFAALDALRKQDATTQN